MFSTGQGQWQYLDGKVSGGRSGVGKDDPAPGQLYNIIEDPEESKMYTIRNLRWLIGYYSCLRTIKNPAGAERVTNELKGTHTGRYRS